MNDNDNNQNQIDDALRRVRASRNCGMTFDEVMEHFCGEYPAVPILGKTTVFLAWHGACVLDPDPNEDTVPRMRAQQ